ncbi:hypothetical protein BY996DRAFT_6436778 [Phakopsora pachyrhizi]|nr:hypothetical protein BY996DRAFT_6436778 [Phakopsora pachyrhizi]
MSDIELTETNLDLIDWSEGEEHQGRKILEEIVRRMKIKKYQNTPLKSSSETGTRNRNSPGQPNQRASDLTPSSYTGNK